MGNYGDKFIYEFITEVPIELDDDTPINIRYANESISGSIVNVSGLRILVGLSKDIGSKVTEIVITANASFLLELLQKRINEIKSRQLSFNTETAMKAFGFQHSVPDKDYDFAMPPSESDFLSEEQKGALAQSLGSEITFVWGPPGTGKTTMLSYLSNIPITPDAIHRYYIDWYALAEGEPGITIEKDYDGDGEVDEIIITAIPTRPTNPSPTDNATDVPSDKTLSWVGDDSDTVTHDVYFGTETNPPLVSEGQAETTYAPTLDRDTTYYWRVTAINEHSICSPGALWEFTTGQAPSWCFIATDAYGTPVAEEIQILREFRDEYLLTNSVGQDLVEFYYRVSPPIAEFITEHPSLKLIVRAGLVPAVAMSTVAVNTTRAEKVATIGLVVLVSVALAVWAARRRGRGSEHT